MNPAILNLVQQHRNRGIVVDTNILLLYIVGQHNRNLIGSFKRVQSYSDQDYFILIAFVKHFSQLITTPHILTQVTDLSGSLNRDQDLRLFKGLRRHIENFVEHCASSKDVCQTDCFIKFGLADANVSELAQSGHLVLTDDFS